MYKSISALIISLFLVISSCQRTEQAPEHTVFRYNEAGNILSLDPAFSRFQSGVWACRQIFSGLVRLDENTHIVPEIATHWEISDDGLEYTFHLRDDVYFHNSEAFLPTHTDSTRAVVAQDFVYSLGRLTDPNVAAPGAWTMNAVDTITTLNDSTLTIKLKEPFPAFLGLLAMPYCMVVPQEAVEFLGADFRTRPIGTGAFYVKYWSEGNLLVLRKNPNFFEKDKNGFPLPYLEAINISFLPDKQTAFMEFLLGKLDLISGLDPGYADEALSSDGKLQSRFEGKVSMVTTPYLNTEYLGIRADLPEDHPLSDIRIRRALNHGFDRAKMMLYLRKNIGKPADGGLIPAGLAGNITDDSNILYNPKLSTELLNQYRAEKGEIKPFVLNVNSEYRDLCEYIQSEWQRLGIPVKVEVLQTAALREAISKGKTDFFRASWVCDYPEGENYLSLLYSLNKSPNGSNYTHYNNPDFDRLYLRAIATIDDSLRTDMYRRLDKMAMDDVPMIIMFYDQAIRFYNPKLNNFTGNTLNHIDLRAVSKSK